MTGATSLRRLRDRLRLRSDPLCAALAACAEEDRVRLPAIQSDLGALVENCDNVLALEHFRNVMMSLGLEHWGLRAAVRRRQIDPSPEAAAALIDSHVWDRRLAEARGLADALDEADRRRPCMRVALEHLLTAEGWFSEARAIARTLEDEPSFDAPMAAARRLEAMASRGRWEEARDLADEAARRWPEHGQVQVAAARIIFLDGRVDEALERSRRLAEPPTDLLAATVLEVEILFEAGRYHEALNKAVVVLADAPKVWPLYSFAYQAAVLAGRPEEYDALAETLAARAPNHPETFCILASKHAGDGEDAAARGMLERLKPFSERRYLEQSVRVATAARPRQTGEAMTTHAAAVASPYRLDGAEIALAMHLYFEDGSRKGLEIAFERLHGAIDLWRHQSHAVLLYLRLLIALGRPEAARAELSRTPAGLRAGKHFRILDLYFKAMDGQHDAASAGWSRLIGECRDPAANAPAAYPETVALKWRERPDDILLFCCVFNGVDYVEWLLDHYRRLGVDHFFFTDNGSTDGTFELLERQDDVSLFQSLDSFARAGCGLIWNNHNIRRFGLGRWCLHVDMDEALVFPGMEEGRDLKALTRYLDAQGFRTVRSTMIDIFPESLETRGDEDPFAASRWIDTDYARFPFEYPPYESVYGGARSRLAKSNLLLTKAPLLKVRQDSWYLTTNHTHTHAPVADLSTALLHYKFVGDLAARLREAIARKEHFLGAGHYRALHHGLHDGGSALKGPHSVVYEGTAQLVSLGLIQDSAAWRARLW